MVRGEDVYFIGESHVLRFADRVVLRGGEPPLVCRAVFLGAAANMASIATEDGDLSPSLRRKLQASRILIDARVAGPGEPRAPDEAAFASPRPGYRRALPGTAQPPLLVFCLGSYDVFATIMDFRTDDFAMPPAPYMHRLAARFAGELPGAASVDEATTWFIGRVKPLQNAFARLREIGFTRMAFLSVMPPTPVDDGAAPCAGISASQRRPTAGCAPRSATRRRCCSTRCSRRSARRRTLRFSTRGRC